MQIYHGIRNLIVGRPCHKQVMPQTIRAGSQSRQELIIAQIPLSDTESRETCHFDNRMGFDLAAQLRYWAGPRCCRNLRRLTGGARTARKRNSYCRSIEPTRQSDQANRLRLKRFAAGSSKEGLHLMIYSHASALARPANRPLAAIAHSFALSAFALTLLAAQRHSRSSLPRRRPRRNPLRLPPRKNRRRRSPRHRPLQRRHPKHSKHPHRVRPSSRCSSSIRRGPSSV